VNDAFKSLSDLTLAERYDLDEILDPASLAEMASSFEELFGVSLRIYSNGGRLLADTRRIPTLYAFLDRHLPGRLAVQKVIDRVRRAAPQPGSPERVGCISGGTYLARALVHDGRVLGRAILGPILDPEITAPPSDLVEAARGLSPTELEEHFRKLPRLAPLEVDRMARHLESTLEVLIFSGLKAHLASNLHLESVKESFRELSEQNDKLKAAHDRLKELDRLKSNFLATVSHELRTPLTSIIGYSEMLLEGIAGDINQDQREFVETIHNKGEQLLGLIKTLLDLSKLESGTMSLRRDMMSCGALVFDVVATLAPTAKKKGVKLQARVTDGVPELYADSARLRQVLLNLTENAIKFTPAGGEVTIAAEAGFMPQGDTGGAGAVLMAAARRPAVVLSVADTGIGIGVEDRDRVFDAFYQVDSSSTREAGGTGLGLSIVKRLVEAHDGLIEIASNRPFGTVFLVTLPSKRPPQ
jgi:two-component system, NarL family, sensor histidine kinase BarA